MLNDLAAGAAVALLNRLLEREDWARARLAPYAGRSALLQAPPFELHLAIDGDGRFAAPTAEQRAAASVTLAVELTSLPTVLVDPARALRNVRLAGDADFAQALSQVLQRLRPEPEDELARYVGDAAAVRIVGLLRAALAQAVQAGRRLADATADYFVAENPLLVTRLQAEEFARGVIELRDAVERLAKRIERLERAAAAAGDAPARGSR